MKTAFKAPTSDLINPKKKRAGILRNSALQAYRVYLCKTLCLFISTCIAQALFWGSNILTLHFGKLNHSFHSLILGKLEFWSSIFESCDSPDPRPWQEKSSIEQNFCHTHTHTSAWRCTLYTLTEGENRRLWC